MEFEFRVQVRKNVTGCRRVKVSVRGGDSRSRQGKGLRLELGELEFG